MRQRSVRHTYHPCYASSTVLGAAQTPHQVDVIIVPFIQKSDFKHLAQGHAAVSKGAFEFLPDSNTLAIYSLLCLHFLTCFIGLLCQMYTECPFTSTIFCTHPCNLLDEAEHPSSCAALWHPCLGRGNPRTFHCPTPFHTKGRHLSLGRRAPRQL